MLLWEVREALDKFFGKEGFVFMKSITLATESCAFDVLYLELDSFWGDWRDANVKIILHNFIL